MPTVPDSHQLIEAMLGGLREGLLAVNREGVVLYVNQAFFNHLGLSPSPGARLSPGFPGTEEISVEEMIRSAALQRFVRRALRTCETADEIIVVDLGGSERFLQAYAEKIDFSAASSGLLITLIDVTRVQHLENVRRDFVANVSHELKTPITSIKGFVETLIDGALDSPEDARRFLAIISRQADRLNAIFEDLLSLSRIEQEKDVGGIKLEQHYVKEIIEAALQSCQYRASERKVSIVVDCPENLQAYINPTLLEQALVNLIENAIKYSEVDQRVTVKAEESAPGAVAIHVIDTGKGIEKSHLPRIFERFYRVDKSRSRREGGTGLGLAIVKHIAQAHGGSATVQSSPGEGSTFTIQLTSDLQSEETQESFVA